MALKFFNSREDRGGKALAPEKIARHSSGWSQFYKELGQQEELRVLDFGPTSSGNINFITGLGHSIYMADIAAACKDPQWMRQNELFADAAFDVERFMDEHLAFGDRRFDVVLLWDTIDYLPPVLADAVVKRIADVMDPGSKLLAFFHVKPDAEFHRYHLRADDQVDMQHIGRVDATAPYTSRQIETLFQAYAGYKFFLAKDNLREIIVTR